MKKKGISKLAKLKIIFYSVITLPLIALACTMISTFVGNVAKYWLNLISYNYFALMIFFIVLVGALMLSDTKGKAKIILIVSLIVIAPIWWFGFMNPALTLDRDIYVMITKSYSEVNGPVVAVNVKRSKNTNTEVIIHDNEKNQNITISFLDQSLSSVFKVGDNTKVKYLPHSLRGITYSNS